MQCKEKSLSALCVSLNAGVSYLRDTLNAALFVSFSTEQWWRQEGVGMRAGSDQVQ